MTADRVPSVPDDFVVPRALITADFRLEPLGPQHNASDFAAWTSSVDHIRATPGFEGTGWPPAGGMSPAENLADLERHAADFEERFGFTYTVLDPEGHVVGCVYIYPSRSDPSLMRVRSWVTARRADLDAPLRDALSAWLADHWPFSRVSYR
ncbi:hypothetical protein [Streptacidiphilus anmyonensis]|uniref:hypothetical protein n=1 Tax=Streptacidiphilus anmyonensis TaxID=405782 RepID=UPI0005A7C068|nr:hypothetical protein [Streptacidiphilus anmyonensis]